MNNKLITVKIRVWIKDGAGRLVHYFPNLTFRMKLYIKNMVSGRCKMLVKAELKKLGLHYLSVNLGEVEILEELSLVKRHQFKMALQKLKLELVEDRRSILVEKIKNAVIEVVHHTEIPNKSSFSVYIAD